MKDLHLHRRAQVVAAVLGLCFVAALMRSFQLQLLPDARIRARASKQLNHKVEVVGRRGSIVDRNGRELAVSTTSASIFINPHAIVSPEKTARALARVLEIPSKQILNLIRTNPTKRFVWVQRQLTREQMERLQAIDLRDYAGVGILPESRREYPYGKLASQVLGFVSVDGKGIEGSEHSFDTKLKGPTEVVMLGRDALGRPVFSQRDQIRLQSRQGEAVQLTLDANLQYTAERALQEAIEKHSARGGTVIILDPNNGEILALANSPGFDPNNPSASKSVGRKNIAVTDPIEPGSVVKPFVVGKALDMGIVKPSTIINAGGGFIRVGRKTIGEAGVDHRFKTISIVDLIRYSSNVGTVVLQQKMGWPAVEDVFDKLGFGQPTGLELGGESRGIFHHPRPGQLLEQATMSFGQGIALTPLQIATAYAILANGGIKVKPHLLKSQTPDPKAPQERVFSLATALQMRKILEKVVEDEGTGTAARIKTVRVAGKTGTSQKIDYQNGGYKHGAYWSSFAGFLPSDDPRYVIYVMVDEPTKGGYYGGLVAAPVFAKIAQAALRFVPTELDLVQTKPQPQQRSVLKVEKVNLESGKMPAIVGLPLVEGMRALEGVGLSVRVDGEGEEIIGQYPPEGSDLSGSPRQTIQLKVR